MSAAEGWAGVTVGTADVTVADVAALAAASVGELRVKWSDFPSPGLSSSERVVVVAALAAEVPSDAVGDAGQGQPGSSAAANDKGVAFVALVAASYKGSPPDLGQFVVWCVGDDPGADVVPRADSAQWDLEGGSELLTAEQLDTQKSLRKIKALHCHY